MPAELPPLPDGPPIADVVYTPAEAVAWIRTMTPGALKRAAERDPKKFPSTKPGRNRGFSGADIVRIVAGCERSSAEEASRRSDRRTTGTVTDLRPGNPGLKPDASRARKGRRAAS